MRILQVGKFYPPTHGGMERVVSELCEGLQIRGHHVRAVVAAGERKPSQSTINGVEVVRLHTSGQILSQPLINGLRNAIEDFKPDVVHYHLPNPMALATGWNENYPTCLTIHAETTGLKGIIDGFWTERFTRRAQALIFSSEQMASRWSARTAGVPICVIPFGFRFRYLKPVGAVQDPSLILFVGRLVHYKGIETLIKAMARVDGKLAIVGTGPLRYQLERLIERYSLSDNIRFIGSVPDDDLVDWYERCAVYVQPSITIGEAFGISMLEAMRMGRPIVSTDLPTGVKSVNQHLSTGLVVQPKDPLSLAIALNTILKDRELANRLGDSARTHEHRFSFDGMIDRHLELYRSLVGESLPSPKSSLEFSPRL